MLALLRLFSRKQALFFANSTQFLPHLFGVIIYLSASPDTFLATIKPIFSFLLILDKIKLLLFFLDDELFIFTGFFD